MFLLFKHRSLKIIQIGNSEILRKMRIGCDELEIQVITVISLRREKNIISAQQNRDHLFG